MLRKAPLGVHAAPAQAITSHFQKSFKAGRMLMSVAPFAAATTSSASSANTLILVMRAVGSFIKLYLLLLFVRVLLSWFPMFEWDSQPWLALRQVRCSMIRPVAAIVLLTCYRFWLFSILAFQQRCCFVCRLRMAPLCMSCAIWCHAVLLQVTDPYLNLFRGLVPPLLGTIDFTPLFGFLILQFLAGALEIGGDDDFW